MANCCMSLILLVYHFKATSEIKKKILASKSLYMSHMEAFQNIVLLHKANTNSTLEDVSSLSAASCCSLDQACDLAAFLTSTHSFFSLYAYPVLLLVLMGIFC
jgi:kinesin family protein 11